MELRTVGVEEELLLVDPQTGRVVPRAPQVLERAARRPEPGTDDLDRELFRHQVETRTPPTSDLAELRAHLVRQRVLAAETAGQAGLAVVAAGTTPVDSGEPHVTRDDRYQDMVDTYGEVARPTGTCGMHVHVLVGDDAEGVTVIDRLAPWLPLLLAVSANSPFHRSRDTGYASWRSQIWSRWPSAGPTERFGSAAGYREASRRLIASGAARDPGMLYFDARLAEEHPTVEVRVADVCTDPDDAVLVAALVRALVATAAGQDLQPGGRPWRVDLLRAAQWRAARYGVADRLLHPITGEPAAAREVLASLVGATRDQLEASGDLALVEEGVARVLAGGGASRQRAAYERSGGRFEQVVADLVERTARG